MPYTESEAPNREKLRRDMEDPMCTKSKTDSVDPMRDVPKRAIELPKREKLLSENVLPRWEKSKTDRELPRRHIP
jgi:hypothetical protein